ncbi:MAG: FAD-binding protein [Saprospiraceae bacterium]
MHKELEIRIAPEFVNDKTLILKTLSQKSRIREEDISHIELLKKSIDARGRQPLYALRYRVYKAEGERPHKGDYHDYKDVPENAPRIIIVGAGPAGYFAALECIKQGLKPIVLDRGKDVQFRRRDLKAIQQQGVVNPNSNYCFGEGGAGTYSDGKLYTRSHKRGKIVDVLRTFIDHGANDDILIDAHPHIGSNKLPQIVQKLRATIESNGGIVIFETKVIDFIIKDEHIKGVIAENDEYLGVSVILATGHSARDIYYLCEKYNLGLEFKPFAIGVRVEHPQALIDKIQYNREERGEHLPPASYRLACQHNDVGVFSFCMCPGGLIVPSATSPGEIVVNGMSLSKRDSPFANAGIVITVDESNIPDYKNKFSGLEFQAALEQSFFQNGDGSQKAPAQRLTDFVNGKVSTFLSESSYIPGLYHGDFKNILPDFIYDSLAFGIMQFDKKMRGYFTQEAQVIGLESRTSAPLKLPRDKQTYMHERIKGLYPCGEGAGYAGGILSAAMDGQNVAKAIAIRLKE